MSPRARSRLSSASRARRVAASIARRRIEIAFEIHRAIFAVAVAASRARVRSSAPSRGSARDAPPRAARRSSVARVAVSRARASSR